MSAEFLTARLKSTLSVKHFFFAMHRINGSQAPVHLFPVESDKDVYGVRHYGKCESAPVGGSLAF